MILPTFLKTLHDGCAGVVELRAKDGTNGRPPVRTFLPPGDIDGFMHFGEQHRDDHVFVAVATRQDTSNGRLENCAHLPALFVDLDFKAIPEDEARRRLYDFPLPLSVAILSGGGLHVYWLLREPLDLQNAADRGLAVSLLRRLARTLGGDISSAEPARCLRLPGTLNVKYDPPRPVRIEHLAEELRYNPSDFDALLPEESAGSSSSSRLPFSSPHRIPYGSRNATLFKLARSLKAKGLGLEAIRAAVREENRTKCDPPLDEGEVLDLTDKAWQQPDRPEFAPRPAEASTQEEMPSDAPEADLPAFPEVAYQGLAADIASLYAEHLEAPKEFVYIDALTFLGGLLATKIRLNSELREEPRMYSVKVARSGTDRKSSSQDTVERFFAPLLEAYNVKVCYGAGSAEGLQRVMEGTDSTILVYDEFRSFVDKAGVQQSVLLPMVATLFHKTKYENSTKSSKIQLSDAHLSLVGACTTDTFVTMFTPQFRNTGFLNRLFVVTGRRRTRHPIPRQVPPQVISVLQNRARRVIERAGRERPALTFTPDAEARWTEWYHALPESPYVTRLDTYGLRLLMLFAAITESWCITRPLVDAVIALLDYELAVRKELDPVDAEGVVARMERLILRHLSKGRMPESRLQALCNVRYYGLWSYQFAKKNVFAQGWVKLEKAGKGCQLWLTGEGKQAASQ